jgi:hypothetical protein
MLELLLHQTLFTQQEGSVPKSHSSLKNHLAKRKTLLTTTNAKQVPGKVDSLGKARLLPRAAKHQTCTPPTCKNTIWIQNPVSLSKRKRLRELCSKQLNVG